MSENVIDVEAVETGELTITPEERAKVALVKQTIENVLKEQDVALIPITFISGDKVASRIDLLPNRIANRKANS